MGAWGPGVFSDDVGCSVRDQYRDLIGEGLEGTAATDALLESFQEVLMDEDSEAPFWLALAVTQWRMGRLDDRVKARALMAIENGAALRSWRESPALAKARQRELHKVAQCLQSPQRAKTKPRKRFTYSFDWMAGELIAFRLPSGQHLVFRVIGSFTDQGGTYPVVEILDWCGLEIPNMATLAKLPIRIKEQDHPPGLRPYLPADTRQYAFGEVAKRGIPFERLVRLNLMLPPTQKVGGFSFSLWRQIDELLEREFGYR